MKKDKRYFIGKVSDVTDEILDIIGGCMCDQFTDNLKEKIIIKLPSTDNKNHPQLNKFKQISKKEAIEAASILKPTPIWED